jgi:hypothetical protein
MITANVAPTAKTPTQPVINSTATMQISISTQIGCGQLTNDGKRKHKIHRATAHRVRPRPYRPHPGRLASGIEVPRDGGSTRACPKFRPRLIVILPSAIRFAGDAMKTVAAALIAIAALYVVDQQFWAGQYTRAARHMLGQVRHSTGI